MNTDSPIGTGDHEHYFYYLNGKNRLEVLDPDGNIYSNCHKKAIHVRKKETHEPWWDLSSSYTLLFSKESIYSDFQERKRDEIENDSIYMTTLKPNYG